MTPLRFFIDFDGTITKTDVVDMILERFGLSQWTGVEKLWLEGKIGSRECLSRQMDLVSATGQEFMVLLDEVQIDPYFVDFVRQTKHLNIPVAIISDGFDIVIDHVLKKAFWESPGLLQNLPVYSNKLKYIPPAGFKVHFPDGNLCEHACANCKERVVQSLRAAGERTVFVGDGLSDRFGARVSDLTFAKNKLLKFCAEHQIQHRAYSNFKEIGEWLSEERKGAHAYV